MSRVLRNLVLMFAVVGAYAAPIEASPISLVNGNFETGTFAGWTTFLTAGGSTTFPPAVTMFDIDGAAGSMTPSFAARFTVGQQVFVDGDQQGGGLFQTFTSAPGLITISAGIASQNIFTLTNAAGGLFSVLVDGVSVGSFDFSLIAGNTVETSLLNVTATVSGGTHELRFLITRPFSPGNTQQFIDNVTIDQTVTAVPEPATLALLGVGLACLSGRGRKVWA